MWLDRLSGHSTPSASLTPRNRSSSPAPRRSSNLAPPLPGQSRRPAFSPRSSSLSLASHASTSSLVDNSRLPNGSGLKHATLNSPPAAIADPLEMLEVIIGRSVNQRKESSVIRDGSVALTEGERAVELASEIEFGGLSLQDYAASVAKEGESSPENVPTYNPQSVEEYERERAKFEDLHQSILGCDNVLKSVETYLTSFQTDLGVVSAEIETLQSRSTTLNTRLDNRKATEKLLGPAVEDFSIAPATVRKIADGPIDESWVQALSEVEKRSSGLEAKAKAQPDVKAIQDIRPLLEDLTHKALERIRDYLVAQIKALRSPNINAQLIQQQSLLRFKDIYVFLNRHQPKLAEEIGQAYINTMRWYYLNHFTRYQKALEKVKLYVMDKADVLGAEEPLRRGLGGTSGKASSAHYDPFTLGRRIDLLRTMNRMAMSSYAAEETSSTQFLEVPFRNFNLAMVDNASSEYAFLTEFFSPHSFHQVARKFTEIFQPTFTLGQAMTKGLVESNVDCLGVLLCVRLNQHFAFELQRRKIPAVDSYINGTNMLLWPRFQIVMDVHSESIRRAMASQSASKGVASALSLTGSDASKQSAAPHQLTQRFAQFLQGILSLSSEAGDDEPVSTSLGRLRTDFEAFLAKLSKSIGEARKRERFLFNNYSLILTIISDTDGKLATEQIEHFEALRDAFNDER